MAWFCALGLMVSSLVLIGLGWPMLWRPRNRQDQAMGLLMALTAITSTLRASFLFTLPPPYPDHLLHVPVWLMSGFALMYGVLPLIYALLMLNVFDARSQDRLLTQATIDEPTGALSRRALNDRALALRAQRGDRPLAVVMIDLDHFKSVNDRFDHAGGDRVLRKAAAELRGTLRGEALLARCGGEEFVALVPVDDMVAARRVAERMREAVAEGDWSDVRVPAADISSSLGVTLLQVGESFETALARADEALHRAKSGGRNRCRRR